MWRFADLLIYQLSRSFPLMIVRWGKAFPKTTNLVPDRTVSSLSRHNRHVVLWGVHIFAVTCDHFDNRFTVCAYSNSLGTLRFQHLVLQCIFCILTTARIYLWQPPLPYQLRLRQLLLPLLLKVRVLPLGGSANLSFLNQICIFDMQRPMSPVARAVAFFNTNLSKFPLDRVVFKNFPASGLSVWSAP